jgi:hypothetical protein
MIEMVINMNRKSKTVTVGYIFSNPSALVIKFGAGAALHYGSGSTKKMRLRLRNTTFIVLGFEQKH